LATPKSEATKARILRAAERLFAERGYDGVSVRQIAAAAGVQLALISYHFRTKDGLYRAVFRKIIDAVAEERLTRLRAIMARQDPPGTIEEVLDALARPWVELRDRRGGRHYAQLIAREAGDPREGKRGIVRDMLDPIAREFIGAMEKVLPDHSRAQVHWAYHYFVGALLLVLLNPDRPPRLSGRLCDVSDSGAVLNSIVSLFSAALRSPMLARPNKPSKSLIARPGGKNHETRHVHRSRQVSTGRRADRRRQQHR
jgi:AcrR family transcriptional regulator